MNLRPLSANAIALPSTAPMDILYGLLCLPERTRAAQTADARESCTAPTPPSSAGILDDDYYWSRQLVFM